MTINSGDAPPLPLEMGEVIAGAKPVEDYLRAVGDELPTYELSGLAPPLFGTAATLGLLLKKLELPPGAIHSLQEVSTHSPIKLGQGLRATAIVERPRQRGALQFITASCQLSDADLAPVISGKTTVLVPNETTSTANSDSDSRATAGTKAPSDLPTVSRLITPEMLVAYAAASGDDNPLHLDAEFAKGTRFGGIISHGMLTLAFISEMLTASLGERWLSSGALKVRFKGAAYLGDTVETWGRNEKSTNGSDNIAVGARNKATGEDLITGTATVS